ncbi:MAG: DUF218 domain-containing protein [Peptococcaceae bacterium]|nr:DUF218 domain-containing protein [Peptococcaceae bacterium]NLM20901.1 DUF218 domain-containing protein [Peptococcaceae bacterium]
MTQGRKLKCLIIGIIAALIIFSGLGFGLNHYVETFGSRYIVEGAQAPNADAVLILGAYVLPNGTASPMLQDRLMTGLELYEQGKSQRILVSGDHGRQDYDEVNAMKQILKDQGVPASHIFMDHAGFNTYDSMYRARDIFQVKKLIIVTQEYHLKRAIFIAHKLGLEAYGVAADRHNYGPVMLQYELREKAARIKDFINAVILKPQPKYLGDVIPVSGDGRVTDDK